MKVIYLTFLEKLTKATDMIKIKREKETISKTLVKFCPSHHTCVHGKQVTLSFLRGGEAMNSTL